MPLSRFTRFGNNLQVLSPFLSLAVPLFFSCSLWFKLASYPYDWDPSEGDSVYYASRLLHGEDLYRSLEQYPMTACCYPPLYYLLLALLSVFFGQGVIVGRCLSYALALLTALILRKWVIESTGSKWAGWITAVLFLAGPIPRLWGGLARVDSLLVCTLSGAFLFLTSGQISTRRVAWGSLCCVAAMYAKPYAFLGVAIALGVLAFRDFRAAWKATLLVGGGSLGILAALQWWSSGWFFKNAVLNTATDFSFSHLWALQVSFLSFYGIVTLLAWMAVLGRREQWKAGVAGYLLATFAISLLSGKLGAASNYYLPLASAVCLGAGCLLGARLALESNQALASCALLIQGLIWSNPTMAPTTESLANMNRLRSAISAAPEPMLIERHMSLPMLAGKQVLWEPCLLYYLYAAQKWDPQPIVEDLRAGRIRFVAVSNEVIVPPIAAILRQRYLRLPQRYEVAQWFGTSTFELYVPKPG